MSDKIGILLANLGTPDAPTYLAVRLLSSRVSVRPASHQAESLDLAAYLVLVHPYLSTAAKQLMPIDRSGPKKVLLCS